MGVTQEQFAAECDKAMAKGGDSAFVYHQIMAVEDFVSFKRVRRNSTPTHSGDPLIISSMVMMMMMMTMMMMKMAKVRILTDRRIQSSSLSCGHSRR